MPVYRYSCGCGYQHDQFLKADQDSIILKCLKCLRYTTARQVRDKSARFESNNDVVGIMRDEDH